MSAAHKPILYGDQRRWGLVHADALDFLREIPSGSLDAIVCDPPYAIGFLDNAWDGADIRRAANRGGERCGAAEAFQRWTTLWATECLRVAKPGAHLLAFGAPRTCHRLTSGIEDAGFEVRDLLLWLYRQGMPKSRQLPQGLGTCLKPAYEPVLLARAPMRGPLAENLERYATGALNIDAARIDNPDSPRGFWPANLLASHTEDCRTGRCARNCPTTVLDHPAHPERPRLLFCAKASKQERETGCEHLPARSSQLYVGSGRPGRIRSNIHPTVKPIEVMQWLVRLVTPPGGVVLDLFTGSATTGIAALLEGRQFFGIEREREYVNVARARLEYWARVAAGSTR